jgi:hypothetical protein
MPKDQSPVAADTPWRGFVINPCSWLRCRQEALAEELTTDEQVRVFTVGLVAD